MIEKNISVRKFFSDDRLTLDKWTFVGILVLCLLGALSLALDVNFLLLREFARAGKALVLLAFTPVLIFLIWICLAMLPFSEKSFSKWVRAVIYIIFFLLFNF